MEKNTPPWLNDLGLKKEHMAFCPAGENPLVWALRTDFLQENLYLRWASENYQVPLLSPEFFQLAFDGNLVEKFSSLHDWSSICYPVYQWEDNLYVAALEPVKLDSELKICVLIAPLSELELGWEKIKNSNLQKEIYSHEPALESRMDHTAEPNSSQESLDFELKLPLAPLEPTEPSSHDKPLNEVALPNFPVLENKSSTEQEKNGHSQNPPPLPDLDFSTLVHENKAQTPSSAEKPTHEMIPEKTQTVSGAFENRTTATSTLHVNAHRPLKKEDNEEPLADLAFENLSIEHLSLESDLVPKKSPPSSSSQQNTPIQTTSTSESVENKTPLRSDKLKPFDFEIPSVNDHNVQTQKEIPREESLESVMEGLDDLSMPIMEAESDNHADDFSNDTQDIKTTQVDDDYTPLPFIVKSEQKNGTQTGLGKNKTEKTARENTQTDHGLPSYIPPGQLVSTEDLLASKDINLCKDIKGVMAFIFNHLKSDYSKLMWIEAHDDGQYYPQLVYGPWHMTNDSWKKSVDIESPNIFRIAHLSNLPFHGEISDNPFNDSYYKLWTGQQKPDFATIYPAYYDDISYGFIVGFEKGPEFDIIGSLKKIENLLSICKNQLVKTQDKLAS